MLRSLLVYPARWPRAGRPLPVRAAVVALLAFAGASVAGAQQPQPDTRTPDVIYVPTPFDVVDRMLDVARVAPGDRLFDLGSGDGRIVIAAARRFGTRGVGIDIDPLRVADGRRNADTAGVTHLVEFRQADLFQTDLRQATVVTLYLLSQLNVQLRPKLFAELRPGARVVSHAFDMGDWPTDSTFSVNGRAVHYWVMPANLAGRWTLTTREGGTERRYELRLEQRYQQVSGTATIARRDASLRDLRVRGDSVFFALEGEGGTNPLVLAGQVQGNRITGTISGDTARSWQASRTGRQQ